MASRTAASRPAFAVSRRLAKSTPASSARSASVLPPRSSADNSSAVMPSASAIASNPPCPEGPRSKPGPLIPPRPRNSPRSPKTRLAGGVSAGDCADTTVAPMMAATATTAVTRPMILLRFFMLFPPITCLSRLNRDFRISDLILPEQCLGFMKGRCGTDVSSGDER